MLDLLVVGAGQGGLTVGFRAMRERIERLAILDAAPAHARGPWEDLWADADAALAEGRHRPRPRRRVADLPVLVRGAARPRRLGGPGQDREGGLGRLPRMVRAYARPAGGGGGDGDGARAARHPCRGRLRRRHRAPRPSRRAGDRDREPGRLVDAPLRPRPARGDARPRLRAGGLRAAGGEGGRGAGAGRVGVRQRGDRARGRRGRGPRLLPARGDAARAAPQAGQLRGLPAPRGRPAPTRCAGASCATS